MIEDASLSHPRELIRCQGTIDLTLTSRVPGKPVEAVCIELYLGTGATGATCLVSSGNTWGYDPTKLVRLRGIFIAMSGSPN